jgi:hypothetical protein
MADDLSGAGVDSPHRCDRSANGVDMSILYLLTRTEQDADGPVAFVGLAGAISAGTIPPASTFESNAIAGKFVVGNVPPAFCLLVVALDALGDLHRIAVHFDPNPVNRDAFEASQGCGLAR